MKTKTLFLFVVFNLLIFSKTLCSAEMSPEGANLLNSKIGNMNFDEALMMLGQPNSILQGNQIFIGTWVFKGSRAQPQPEQLLGLTPEQGIQLYSTLNSMPVPNEILELIFDKDTNLLKQWRYKVQ